MLLTFSRINKILRLDRIKSIYFRQSLTNSNSPTFFFNIYICVNVRFSTTRSEQSIFIFRRMERNFGTFDKSAPTFPKYTVYKSTKRLSAMLHVLRSFRIAGIHSYIQSAAQMFRPPFSLLLCGGFSRFHSPDRLFIHPRKSRNSRGQ